MRLKQATVKRSEGIQTTIKQTKEDKKKTWKNDQEQLKICNLIKQIALTARNRESGFIQSTPFSWDTSFDEIMKALKLLSNNLKAKVLQLNP